MTRRPYTKPKKDRALRPSEVQALARYDGWNDAALVARQQELKKRLLDDAHELHIIKLARKQLALQQNPMTVLAEALRKEGHELDAPSFERARLELDRKD
ncbi:hypothetical protein [Xylella phage Bacata]|nr:hypothetical protein JT315_gp59 [Xylella phage Bacata]CAA2367837.1 hypothetical protein [Xylella phage Bacata]